MSSIRWWIAAGLTVLFVGVTLLVAGVGIYLSLPTAPLYSGAASVPSRANAAPTGRFTRPAEDAGRLARTLVARDNLPGLSVAVAKDGEIAWAEGFGWADVESQTAVTPVTRFRLGALSKPLTAMAAARLRDEGRLDLDAPVQRYVPAYPAKAWPITARQLMGDVGGVHRIRGDGNDAMPVDHCDRVDDAVAMLAGDPLQFEPGTQHRYSIWGWVLVSATIQGAAGEPFPRAMQREVFEPLGMTRTVVEETANLVDVAHGTDRPPDYSCLAGGGAFLSTPTDLVRLGSAMLKPGFLKAGTIADFQQPTRLASGTATTYALGWTVATARLAGKSVRVVSHRGSPSGGTITLLTFPELGLAVAVAANVTDAKGVGPFALDVAAAFSGS
jgi:serine beta-lactamase-like protein LACTB